MLITGGTGACTVGASYWDLGIRGDTGPANHGIGKLAPSYSIITDAGDYAADAKNISLHNTGANPYVLSQYCNGSRTPPEYASGGYNVPPGISDATVPNPIFSLSPAATVDEGNNWINMTWGPLSLVGPVTNTLLGNYGPSSDSSVINYVPRAAGASYNNAPALDFYGTSRKTNNAVDAGAVEYVGVPIAMGSVTGGPLAFGSVVVNTTSATKTLTLNSTGTAPLTGITITVSAPFSRAGGTCAATLAAGATCTITVTYSPKAVSPSSGTVTISANVAVTGSPVSLTGTGIAAVNTVSFTPATWTTSQTRNCPGTGLGTIACSLDPAQAFTLTNTGNVPLTGVTQGLLGVPAGQAASNAANYTAIAFLSTCGVGANTTLAPGAACRITVQFKPLTTQPVGLKTATISVTDSAGTQTSTLSGTAR